MILRIDRLGVELPPPEQGIIARIRRLSQDNPRPFRPAHGFMFEPPAPTYLTSHPLSTTEFH
jgi:hypothetical protein